MTRAEALKILRAAGPWVSIHGRGALIYFSHGKMHQVSDALRVLLNPPAKKEGKK